MSSEPQEDCHGRNERRLQEGARHGVYEDPEPGRHREYLVVWQDNGYGVQQ